MNAHERWMRLLGLSKNNTPLGAHAQAMRALSDRLARRAPRRNSDGRCALVMPDPKRKG